MAAIIYANISESGNVIMQSWRQGHSCSGNRKCVLMRCESMGHNFKLTSEITQPENQVLWFNPCIQIDNNPFYRKSASIGSWWWFHLIGYGQKCLPINTYMEFKCILSAIPMIWKIRLKEGHGGCSTEDICVPSSNQFYKMLTTQDDVLCRKRTALSNELEEEIYSDDFPKHFSSIWKVTN